MKARRWLIPAGMTGVVVPFALISRPAEITPKIVQGAWVTDEYAGGGFSCRCHPPTEWFGLGRGQIYERLYEVHLPYEEVVASLREELAAEGYQVHRDPKWKIFQAHKRIGAIEYSVRATPPDGIVSQERYPVVSVSYIRPTNAADLIPYLARELGKRVP